MAITINSEPQEFELVEDGVFVKATTNLFVVNPGGFNVNTLVFQNPIVCTHGQIITISYGDVYFTLTAKDSPNNSGYEVPTRAGYLSDVAFRNDFITYLNKNYYIQRDFILSGGTVLGTGALTILLYAKFLGNYSINKAPTLLTVPAIWTVTNSIGITLRENYKMVAVIFVEQTEGQNDFEKLAEIPLTPNLSNQQVTFQLQRYLRSAVNGVDWPTYEQNTPLNCVNINKKYYVVLSEFYGGTPLHYNFFQLANKRILFGGNLKSQLTKHQGFFAEPQAKFMTWFGKDRYVTLYQDVFLAWTNGLTTDETVRLMVNVFYEDGTNSGATQKFEVLVKQGTTINFPAGFLQLGLDQINPSKTPIRWTLNLTRYITSISNWGVFTETINCYVEPADYMDRFVYFQNTLGGVVEVARLRGEFEKGITVSSEEFLTEYAPDTVDGFGQVIRTDVEAFYTYQLSTGLLSIDELLPYIQLLKTKHAAIKENGQLIEITILPGTFEIVRKETAEAQYVYAFNFTAKQTAINKGFSV